jgi:hypothetical protein
VINHACTLSCSSKHCVQYHKDMLSGGDSVFPCPPILEDGIVVLLLADKDMLDWCCVYGHGATLVVDTTFGTNKYGYPLLGMHVMDESGSGRVACMAVLSQETEELFEKAFQLLTDRMKSMRADWAPSCVLIDACQAERNAARYVANWLYIRFIAKAILRNVTIAQTNIK